MCVKRALWVSRDNHKSRGPAGWLRSWAVRPRRGISRRRPLPRATTALPMVYGYLITGIFSLLPGAHTNRPGLCPVGRSLCSRWPETARALVRVMVVTVKSSALLLRSAWTLTCSPTGPTPRGKSGSATGRFGSRSGSTGCCPCSPLRRTAP